MSELPDQTWQYFTPATMTFWTWSDHQQAIVWTTSETIVFRSELAALLEGLIPIGLPPLDAILLTIATCRSSVATTLPQLSERLNFDQLPMGGSLTLQLENIRSQLWGLSKLPADLRSGMDGKQTILTLVAENGLRVTNSQLAKHCVEWLRQGYTLNHGPLMVREDRTSSAWSVLLRGLHDGLASVNEASVRLRLRTGLEPADIPQPIPLELPEPQPAGNTVRDLLQELEQDGEHAGMFRLVKRLLSVVTLPRPVSAPSDQPLGGVSDITNRGPFDRLLLSELAHDVDVLMSRVALNEALYIRREIPPTIPPRQRLVLLDCGIRMWGLPRLYAGAVALALAATQHDSVTTQIFRAEKHTIVPVELSSRAKFLEHLEVLELPVHPGLALPAFVSEGAGTAADYVIVTSEDVLADPEFRLCLTARKFPDLYLVVVNRKGSLRLIHRTQQGERLVRQALLDLDQILHSTPPAKVKLRDPSIATELPAIFYVRPFPLLLCGKFDRNRSRTLSLPGGSEALLTISADRRLMLWCSKQEWARQLSDRLPPGVLIWSSDSCDDSGMFRVILGDWETGKLHLLVSSPTECEPRTVQLDLPPGRIQGVSQFAGILHVVLIDQTHLYSTTDGKRLGSGAHGREFIWIRDRFYKAFDGCHVLAFDGRNPAWQMILDAETMDPGKIKSIFDSQAVSAPVVVTISNEFIVTGSLQMMEFQWSRCSIEMIQTSETVIDQPIGNRALGRGSYYRIVDVSRGGNLIRLSNPNEPSLDWIIDLSKKVATEVTREQGAKIINPLSRHAISGNLRTRFELVGVHDGALILMTNRQKFVTFVFDLPQNRIQLATLDIDRWKIEKLIGFRRVPLPEEIGFELKIAEWKDGSRTYLDSRGMLHLRSSNTMLPELTLVLHDAQISGWSSSNLFWGDPACTGPLKHRVAAMDVLNNWLVPFCERLKA